MLWSLMPGVDVDIVDCIQPERFFNIMKPKVLLALRQSLFQTMFSPRDQKRLNDLADVINPDPPSTIEPEFVRDNLPGADIAITSWGSATFNEDVLSKCDTLKLVTHAGGSVKSLVSDAFWDENLRVTSAAAAISYGVAEYCLGLILVGSKRAFWLGLETRNGHWENVSGLYGGWHEIYQQKIGIIGAGFVGRQLAMLLRNFTCDVLVFDPYLSEESARELNVTKVDTLDELFEQCLVVSLNAPTTPETIGMIRGHHFAKLCKGALFINTARSILINEEEMLEELKTGRFVAVIDVTEPEPPPLNHLFRNLPNVWLTPHVAGTVAENQMRIGTMVVDEIEHFVKNEPYRFEVTREQLQTLA
jgi:phosphoglycerate dehydrogenase-like enzyme